MIEWMIVHWFITGVAALIVLAGIAGACGREASGPTQMGG